MIELKLLDCNWIQWDNIACASLVGMAQIIRDQGVPDQAWELRHGREVSMSGFSIYGIADVGLPTQMYIQDTLWPNIPDYDDQRVQYPLNPEIAARDLVYGLQAATYLADSIYTYPVHSVIAFKRVSH